MRLALIAESGVFSAKGGRRRKRKGWTALVSCVENSLM